MSNITRLLGIAALVVAGLFGQPTPALLSFDVASVKRIQTNGNRPGDMKRQTAPGSLMMRNVTLGSCIRWAYGLEPNQIIGPTWIDPPTDFLYNIDARAPGPAPDEQLKLMLQTLLAERFAFFFHRETRTVPIYLLLADKPKATLTRADDTEESGQKPGAKPFQTIFSNISMAVLATRLSPPLTSRSVVDRTGLQGGFDFTLEFGPYLLDSETGKPLVDSRGHIDMERAVMRALPDQLGLRLASSTTPLDVIVIDRINKLPTAN